MAAAIHEAERQMCSRSRTHGCPTLTQSGRLSPEGFGTAHRRARHPPHRQSRCARLWRNSKNQSSFSSCKNFVAFAPPAFARPWPNSPPRGKSFVTPEATNSNCAFPFPVLSTPKETATGNTPFAPAEDRATQGCDPSADLEPCKRQGRAGR